MNVNEIGYFQFENLIKNRIPFLLLNLGVDFTNFFQGLDQKHLESVEIQTTKDTVIEDILKRDLNRNHAVVLVCEKGLDSGPLVAAIENLGFMNVYSICGGFKRLVEEKIDLDQRQ